MVKDQAIISVGINAQPPVGHPNIVYQRYANGIAKIAADLQRTGFSGEFLYWDRDYPEGSPPHEQIPFAFKPWAFKAAKTKQHNLVLWMDSSIRLRRPVDPLFRILQQQGYLFIDGCHSVGEYCSDAALAPLKITREESFQMCSCWACVMGLNFNSDTSTEFLDEWLALSLDGITFPGPKWSGINGWPHTASIDIRVKGHRYDQTAASVIATRLGMRNWMPRHIFDHFFVNDRTSVRLMRETCD